MDQSNPSQLQPATKTTPRIGMGALSIVAGILIIGSGAFYWNQQRIQNNDLKAQNSALLAQAQANCKGTWNNGSCTPNTCLDSDASQKPNDIYIKGNVVYTNDNGVSTTTTDQCSGSGEQVNEMWCYESPAGSGNSVPGNQVSNYPKGCLDGACVQ